jgi:hypothetical protein
VITIELDTYILSSEGGGRKFLPNFGMINAIITIQIFIFSIRSRDCSLDTASGYALDDWKLIPECGKIFLL